MERFFAKTSCWVLGFACFVMLSACTQTGIFVTSQHPKEDVISHEPQQIQESQEIPETPELQEAQEAVKEITPVKQLKKKIPPLVLVLDVHHSEQIEMTILSFKEHLARYLPEAEYMYHLVDNRDEVNASQFVSPKTKSPPAIIISLGTTATEIAQNVFPDTPILATMLEQENILNHMENRAAILNRVSLDMQFQWLKRILPNARRVGILFAAAQNGNWLREVEEAAQKEDIAIFPYEITSPADLQTGLKYIRRNADVLMAIPDQTVYSGILAKEVLLFCFRDHLPFVGLSASWVKAGALYAIEIDYGDLGRQTAVLANKILTEQPLGKTNIFHPKGVIFSLNIRVKNYLQLEIDPEIIKEASIVYE